MKLILCVFSMLSIFQDYNAQTNFLALKKQFLGFQKANNQDSSLIIARKMSELAFQEQGDTSYWFALSTRFQGNVYNSRGNTDSTFYYWEKSINLFKKYHFNNPDYVKGLINLGNLNLRKGFYKEAEFYLTEALGIQKSINGEMNSEYSIILNNLGVYFKTLGNYQLANKYYLEALKITKNTLGTAHIEYAMGLNNLGVLSKTMGDFKSAEIYIKQALEIYKGNNGVENVEYAKSLNNLGVIYKNIGDYKSALTYLNQSLELRKKILGENHPDFAGSLTNLGNIYKNIGDLIKAEDYYQKSLEINKIAFGPEHAEVASSMNSLGILYVELKKNELAEKYLTESLSIMKKTIGEMHPEYGMNLFNLGLYYSANSNYTIAEKHFLQSLNIYEKALGVTHPRYLNNENKLAYFYLRINRKKDAYNILNKNFIEISKQITDNFEWLNENQKEAFWDNESSFYDNLSWFANESYQEIPEVVNLNYNSVLLSKSKLLETKISTENYYREVEEMREKLAFRRRLLAKMESEGSTDKDKLDKLYSESDSLDKRLSLSWPEYAQQKKNLNITWYQIQQNLDKGEAAIEFVRFKNKNDSLYYYNALVLKKGGNPMLIQLCKEAELTVIPPTMGFSAYYPLIWQPLESALDGIKTIYYAPAGELYNIPFHALYAPKREGDKVLAAKTDKRGVIIQNEKATTEQNAEYLMDRYAMHQLTSTRYLAMGLKQKEKEKIENNIAIVGGVNYDYLPEIQNDTKKTKKNKIKSRSYQSASGKLAYLEGTKKEVEQIASSVLPYNWQATLLENNNATEEMIIQMENKEAKSILHIATHGYAFPEYDFKDTTINKNSLRYSYRYSTNPLVRSGLILAGGNWAWTGSDTLTKLGAEQNGILTALEVSQLNLKKTKLVVLSACETGLGKIEGSEGTFGLKRGFKLAGVEQMIVSLWSVPDKETMELMTLFYSDLTKSLNPVISFEKAQKEMRNKYPTDPEKWAGFVLVR